MNNFTVELDKFMSFCVTKQLSPKTMRSYEQSIGLFFLYVENERNVKSIDKIKTEDIVEYIEYLKSRGKYTVTNNDRSLVVNRPENRTDYKKSISTTTIANYLRNIKVFFTYAHDEGLVAINPAKKVKNIKPERKHKKLLSKTELATIFRAMDKTTFHGYRNYIIAKLILDSGMRIGETLALKEEDIDFRFKAINLERNIKYDKPRIVYISQSMIDELKRWIRYKDRYSTSEFLFPTNRGTMLSEKNYESYLSDIGKKYGIDVTPHVLRNNYAKYFLMSGGNITTLSRLLGHSSVEVTQKAYLDFTDKELGRMYKSPLENLGL